MKEILIKLRRLGLYLSASPDNELDSERADRLNDTQEVIEFLVNDIPINCLAYALRFWKENKKYKILYDGNHVINVPDCVSVNGFLPLSSYGYEHFINSFAGLLTYVDIFLLKEYLRNEQN